MSTNEPYTPSSEEVREPGIYVLDYDPTDSPMEHDVLRLTASGDWFKVGHGLPITFHPNDHDTFERLIPESDLASVRAEAEAKGRAAAIKDWHNSGRQQHTERELGKARADRDALAAAIENVREWVRAIYPTAPNDGDAWIVASLDHLDSILSTAPADVLAERDARMRAEGAKQALLDTADAWETGPAHTPAQDWLRARATQEDTNGN